MSDIGVFTSAGRDLLATALQTAGANVAISYIAIGLGAGTLSSSLTSGNTYTSLPLTVPLTVGVASGQSLTLIDSSGDLQNVTATGNSIGDAAIGVVSFIASATFGIGSGVVDTPLASDIALQDETYRLGAIPGTSGANVGESLNPGYFDPTTPTNVYLEVGFFGGSTASITLGTGTLIGRDVVFWSHTYNGDSNNFQGDSIV
jgi:hypothetical protein